MQNPFPIIIIRKKHVEEISTNLESVALQLARAQRTQMLLGVVTVILVVAVVYQLFSNSNN